MLSFVENSLDPMSIAPDAPEAEDGAPVTSEIYLEAAVPVDHSASDAPNDHVNGLSLATHTTHTQHDAERRSAAPPEVR